MQRTIVKRVRLTDSEARELARLAKRQGKTESDILREGLDRVSILAARNKAIDQLIRWAEEETKPYEKPDVRPKW